MTKLAGLHTRDNRVGLYLDGKTRAVGRYTGKAERMNWTCQTESLIGSLAKGTERAVGYISLHLDLKSTLGIFSFHIIAWNFVI